MSKRKPRKFVEFSKRAIVAMIVLWFIGAAALIAVVLVQLIRGDYAVSTSDLATYISEPIAGGVLGYMIKSAVENREKIKGGKPQEDRSI